MLCWDLRSNYLGRKIKSPETNMKNSTNTSEKTSLTLLNAALGEPLDYRPWTLDHRAASRSRQDGDRRRRIGEARRETRAKGNAPEGCGEESAKPYRACFGT